MSQIRKPGPPWVVLCPRQGCWEQTISGASPLLRSHFQTCHTHRFPVGSNIRQTLIKAVAIDSLVRSMATGKGSPVQRQSAGVTRHFRGSGGGEGGTSQGSNRDRFARWRSPAEANACVTEGGGTGARGAGENGESPPGMCAFPRRSSQALEKGFWEGEDASKGREDLLSFLK